MTLNIAQYLAAGYGADEILKFIEKIFPNVAKATKSAQKTGKSAEEILKLFSNLTPKQLKQADKNASKLNYDNPLEVANEASRDQSMNPVYQGAKDLGKAALLAGGIGGAVRGIPAIAQGIGGGPKPPSASIPRTPYQSTIQQSSQMVNPGISISNASGLQSQQGQVQAALRPQMESTAPQVNQKVSSQTPFQQNLSQIPSPSGASPQEKANAIVSKLGIEDVINYAKKKGNSLENITKIVIDNMQPDQKAEYQQLSRSGQIPPMIQLVKDFISIGQVPKENAEIAENQQIQPQNDQNTLDLRPNQENQEKISPENEDLSNLSTTEIQNKLKIPYGEASRLKDKSSEKPKKGSLVAGPKGIVGEVKELRNGKALVESNGKLHAIDEKELEMPPIPEKDLADLYEDLLRGQEKETGEETSRNVYWAGYDPEENELLYLPHLGPAYIYDKIPEEDTKLLTSVLTARKTTGENFIGTWAEGSKSPIGAAMSALIRKLQSERGKGKEYSGKFSPIYSAHEPAQLALKKKKKKKNEK